MSDFVRLFGLRSSRRGVLTLVAVVCLLVALMIASPGLATHYIG
jgi:hypothetical protein